MDGTRQKLSDALKKYWGYDSFRPGQLEAIESVCAGRDTLALMPTGAGKSLLYQLPAMVREGVCIVVTPLVSLMKDQTDRLRRLGINAAAIHSGLTTRQADLVLDNATWGDVKFLYVAPERIPTSTFRTRVGAMNVSLIAVDEAHCISQWGYDFRPSYLRIAELRERLPGVPLVAMTASAIPRVVDDIMQRLGMSDGVVRRTSFARPNLSFSIRRCDDKLAQLARIMEGVAGCGIVYVRTREGAQKLAEWLRDQGVSADHYHGGMTHRERGEAQEAWSRGRTRVVVATNAFGMGIDKADVRMVVHYDIPDSLEAYYQEAGRAGRDGRTAYAVLLTSSDDRSRAVRRFDGEYPPMEKIKECYEHMFNYLQVATGEGKYASFSFNIHEFASRARMFTGTALNAIKILQQNGYLTLTDEADNPPCIAFTVGRDELYRIRIDREELDVVIRTILRLYAGVFHDRLVAIDPGEMAHASGYTVERIGELLKRLWQLRIIKYVPGNRSPVLFLDEERLPAADVFISPESYAIRKQMNADRLEAMYDYADNTTGCRSALLQRYFGQEDAPPCGVCDVCIAEKRRKRGMSPQERESAPGGNVGGEILMMLREGGMTVKQIVGKFMTDPDNVLDALDELMQAGKISVSDGGRVQINK